MRKPRDFAIAAMICVAEQDGRECSWYAVYNKILQDYIFTNCDGEQSVCGVIPQYSLVAKYDTGHSPETDAIEGHSTSVNAPLLCLPSSGSPQTPSDVIMRSPTDPGDTDCHLPRTPVDSRDWEVDTTLSSFSSRSPSTSDHSPSTGNDIPVNPKRPFFDSPLSPFPERMASAVSRSHASQAIQLPASPTPLGRTSATNPTGETRVLRRSLRAPRSPLIPVQRLPSELLETPPRDKKAMVMKSTRIPDFIGALYFAQKPRPLAEEFPTEFTLRDDEKITTRTILIVEVKPASTYTPNIWRRILDIQVNGQIHHAFEFNEDLDCLGVMIGVGHHWIYLNVHRPPPSGLTYSQRRDPDYMSSPGSWSDTSSDATSEILESSPQHNPMPTDLETSMDYIALDFILRHPKRVPRQAYIESCLLDRDGQSERFFQEVLEDLRKHNQDIWK